MISDMLRISAACALVFAIALQSAAPLFAASAGSTFTTSLTTNGAPSTPPTVPANLVATPVSSSQIDLTWDPSTGYLYGVSGYRIFRDSAFLATTTGTTYSDLGLAADTSYSYVVEAFDSQFGMSGQSAPVSTTTLSSPVVPPNPIVPVGASGGSTGYIQPQTRLSISGVSIQPDLARAIVSFATNMPAQTKIFWGITPDFEKGSISGLFYGTSHELLITGLDQGTPYYVRIQATNNQGETAFTDARFVTRSLEAPHALANPSEFSAVARRADIALSWKNPSDPSFSSVRIIRSDRFYPRDPFDGVPVYDGRGSSFIDAGVVPGKTYYYSIFAKGNDGAYSSGAVAQARIALPGETNVASSGDPFANLPKSSLVDPKIDALVFSDFIVMQDGRPVSLRTPVVARVDSSKNTTIRLDYAKVPEILKTIAFTLVDPTDATKTFTFLLRVNADKTAYEATIGPLSDSGIYELHISVLDYQNQGLKRIYGQLDSRFVPAPASQSDGLDMQGLLAIVIFVIICVALLVVLRMVAGKRKRSKEAPICYEDF